MKHLFAENPKTKTKADGHIEHSGAVIPAHQASFACTCLYG